MRLQPKKYFNFEIYLYCCLILTCQDLFKFYCDYTKNHDVFGKMNHERSGRKVILIAYHLPSTKRKKQITFLCSYLLYFKASIITDKT